MIADFKSDACQRPPGPQARKKRGPTPYHLAEGSYEWRLRSLSLTYDSIFAVFLPSSPSLSRRSLSAGTHDAQHAADRSADRERESAELPKTNL